ncbi:MAG: protein kinase [Fimbriimonadaceae bacterium]|nr:protein kinase [Fimbriimonadaceae bacterium]
MSSPPTTLGQYQIIREIARSNDIVYEAYDPLMNRRVAVKELNMPSGATAAQAEERIQRFKREAQAAGTLNHANIMTVYSFAEDNGRTFMAMEFLDGHTLRNEIDTKGIIPMDHAVEIALAVLEGLAHAHRKGVIHRDIKPDNIQILSNGQIKITDFGIARLTFQPNLTMDGQVFGTPSYMSPEQVVGKEIDARSDLFSVGVLLYEMIAGSKPFSGDSVVAITYAIMNKEPAQPAQMPYRMWQVIQRSLEKSAAGRYPSAEEMMRALREAVIAQSPSAPPAPDPQMNSAWQVPAPTQAVYNPYQANVGVPPPPPMMTQAAPIGTPVTTPYDPYGAPPPTYNYNVPPVMAPAPAPAPANPYGYAPYQVPSMPPPGPLPQYYPPPPRRPLVSPEWSAAIRKTVLMLLLFGLVLALVTVAVQAIAAAWQRYAVEERDRTLVAAAVQQDPRIALNERIANLESLRTKATSPSAKEEIARALAVLYEEQGRKFLANRQDPQAEASYQRATSLDEHNPALLSNLASLYQQRAMEQQDARQRLELLQQSADKWASAADREAKLDKRDQYREQAALVYLAVAYELSQSGDRLQGPAIRQALYRAQQYAPPNSDTARRAQELMRSLG